MNFRRRRDSSMNPGWGSRLQPPAPDAIIFDMDGVLADVRDSYRECIIRTADVFGCTLTDAMISEAKERGNSNNDWELTRDLLATEGISMELEKIIGVFQDFYLGYDDYPGLRLKEQLLIRYDLLSDLADSYPLAIVTGRPRDEAIWFLRRFQIDHFFKCLIGLDDAREKPDPEGIKTAIQELDANVAWMIGDTPDDMRAARGANAEAVGVAPAGAGAMKVALSNAGACIVLADVNELESILLERFQS